MPSAPQRVLSALRPDDLARLQRLARLAPDARLALVGGAVRDALLGLAPSDLDVVVEGASVEPLAQASGLPFVYHARYDNATLRLPDGRDLDLVHGRAERYARPGAAPDVRPGTLHEDLARRDFGVNAMALVLPARAGDPPELLDPFGGRDDLAARQLRPLHGQSFLDDASRLARAARLSARLDFDLAPEGHAQIGDALTAAPHTPRLRLELPLVFAEARPGAVLTRLRGWQAQNLLGADAADALTRLDDRRGAGHDVPTLAYVAAWLGAQPDPPGAARDWGAAERAVHLLERARGESRFAPDAPETFVRHALEWPAPPETLRGADVMALGVPSGPEVGRALGHLARLRREGQVRTLDEERAALRAYLSGVAQ